MKTLLISAKTWVPDPVRDIVERGSTSLETCRATELDPVTLAKTPPDRIVFWQAAGENEVGNLAQAVATRQSREAAAAIMFVAAGAAEIPSALAPDQVFVWPGDEDRLKMAFMTGA